MWLAPHTIDGQAIWKADLLQICGIVYALSTCNFVCVLLTLLPICTLRMECIVSWLYSKFFFCNFRFDISGLSTWALSYNFLSGTIIWVASSFRFALTGNWTQDHTSKSWLWVALTPPWLTTLTRYKIIISCCHKPGVGSCASIWDWKSQIKAPGVKTTTIERGRFWGVSVNGC